MNIEAQTQEASPNGIYHIGGIPVQFPYKPYGSQLAFMGRVISTLDRSQKQGHCHALLESPTGTGKTLSLLCSALAWQRHCASKHLYGSLTQSKPNPEAISDPLGHGGGFVPEPEPSSNLPTENVLPDPSAKTSANKKKKDVPTIFYASRTHSQITQAIREYRKTSYRVPMAVLGSRKHYCTNTHVSGRENIDEECKLLMKSKEGDQGCLYFRNMNKLIGHPSLKKGGCNEAHDIEDLVKVGRLVRGCSYFAARTMAQDAQLVFCPYSYILNPTIRRAMEVDLKRSIVILDEAHNIEDMARDAASVDIEEDILFVLQGELEQLRTADSQIYPPLHEMIEGVISWIGQKANNLVKREFQHYSSCWTGDKALTELQEAGISQQFFRILQECTIQAIKAANDAETEVPHLSGMSVMALEGLVSSLCYFFSGNGSHALDYQLVLQRYIKRDSGRSSGKWTQSLSLWCMNPAVSFTEIADLSMSVILTSGTLSPMSSFSSELGVKFETCMEAPHVIDVESQLWAAVVSAGPGNCPLNASYKTADGYEFQDALGTSLEEICKIVPGGALVFFPSYSLMEKLCTRWRETGQWCRLNAQKSLFVEPRGHQDDFEQTLKDYYDSIRGSGPMTWKIKKGKKRGLKHTDADETLQHNIKGGSAFLAVCRGKVSEGIDFSDENARVIVIVGIPFPNIHDLKVGHKKTFNDMYKSSKNLLSGSEWYCQQAFRALNQAAGRCIRHRFDYGAIIFMDERYKEDRNIAYVSKWIRKSIKRYSSFDKSLEALQSFFQDAKERSNQSSMNTPKVSDIEKECVPSMQPEILSKRPGKRKIQRINRARRLSQEVASNNVVKTEKGSRCLTSVSGRTDNSTLHKFYSKSDVDLTFAMTNEKDVVKCTEDIDSGCSLQTSGQSKFVRIESSDDGAEEVVKETPGIHDNATVADSAELSNNENSDSTIVQVNNDSSGHISFHSSPVDKSSGTLSEENPSLMVTPERTKADIDDVKPEINLSRNLSVNSHTHKRREPMSFSLVNYPRIDSISNLDGKPQIDCAAACSDSNRKIDFSSDVDCSEFQNTFLNVSQKPPLNSYGASCSSSDVSLDKRLHLCCSLCTKSLGRPENQFLINCSLTSSSKVHLTSFAKSRMENITMNGSGSVHVVVSDKSSVNWRLCNMSTSEDRAKHDTWCEKDGCVFRTVFCPFCTVSDRFLGLLIIATDAENVHLLNKILFYSDRLEIKNVEASKDMASPPIRDSNLGQAGDGSKLDKVSAITERGTVAVSSPFDKFLYTPDQQNSGGWRSTKSKLRLRKRGLTISSED